MTSKRKRKATNPPVNFDEILADDIRMENQKVDANDRDHEPGDIILGMPKHKSVRLTLLVPILKERFYGDRCIS